MLRRSPPETPSIPPEGTVAVGSFDFAESVILGRIYGGALEFAGFPVRYSEAIGPRELVIPAFDRGS